MFNFFHATRGMVNQLIAMCGGEMIDFTGNPDYFRTFYVFSGVWQTAGYSAVIYISALAGVSPELIEAGIIDGTTGFRKFGILNFLLLCPLLRLC